MRYLVELVNKEIFEGERKWYYAFHEASGFYKFTNVVFKAEGITHSQYQLKKIFIPVHSIVYLEPISG